MTDYLGNAGRLIAFECETSGEIEFSERYALATTIEGRRRAQIIPEAPRVWGGTWPATGKSQMAKLHAFISGAWGPGPWHWVPQQAHSQNVLTPREAMLVGLTVLPSGLSIGGPTLDSDGEWAPRSLIVSTTATAAVYIRNVPVIEGTVITYSADISRRTGIPGLTVGFYDALGAPVAGALAGYGTGTNGMQRVSVTGIVPPGAVTMGLGVRAEVSTLVRPQVTWTDEPVEFSAGYGCRSAIVDAMSEELLLQTCGDSFSKAGFTISEVM